MSQLLKVYLVRIAYAQSHCLNMHTQLSSELDVYTLTQTLIHAPYFVLVNSEASEETVRMHRLVVTITDRH